MRRCTQTGSRFGFPEGVVCGACGWTDPRIVASTAEAEQILIEHHEQIHDGPRPEFFWAWDWEPGPDNQPCELYLMGVR